MKDILKFVKIVVYYVNEERINWIKEQIKILNISIDFEFVKGFTKEDGEGYIKSLHSSPIETEGHISCTRTFVNILYKFSNEESDKKYIITMEDDGCIIKGDFEEKVISAIEKYKKWRREVDYVCLGYGPFDIERLKLRNTGNDEDFFWGFWTSKNPRVDFDRVYGGQMLLFDKIAANQISDVLYQKNTDEIRKKVNERFDYGLSYSYKIDVLLGDHILPLLFKQSVIYPPLCIEGDFVKTETGDRNFEIRDWSPYLNLDDYLINKN